MKFNKEQHLDLLKFGDPEQTIAAFARLFESKKNLVKALKEDPDVLAQIVPLPDSGLRSFKKDLIKINKKIADNVIEYCNFVEDYKEQMIATMIAFETPIYSSSLNTSEIVRTAHFYISEVRNQNRRFFVNPVNIGKENIYLDLNKLTEENRTFFSSFPINLFNKETNETFDVLNKRFMSHYFNNLLTDINKEIKEKILGQDENLTIASNSMIEQYNYLNYAKSVMREFSTAKDSFHKNIIDKIEKMSKKYGPRVHLHGMIATKENLAGNFSYKEMNEVVVIMEENFKANEIIRGTTYLDKELNVINLKPSDDSSGYFTYEENNFHKQRLIALMSKDLTQTIYTHEVTHHKDFLQGLAGVSQIIQKINSVREEKGLINVGIEEQTFQSENNFKDILKDLNEYHKFENLISKIKVPMVEDMIKISKQMFNLQFFGKEDFSSEELRAEPAYTNLTKSISKIIAKDFFQKIFEEDDVIRSLTISRGIKENPDIKYALLKILEKSIESSAIPHIAIATTKDGHISKFNIETPYLFNKNDFESNKIYFINMGIKDVLSQDTKNLYITETKRVVEDFLNYTHKFFLKNSIDNDEDIKKLNERSNEISMSLHNVVSKNKDVQKNITELDPKDIPTQLTYLKETEVLITPISMRNLSKGLSDLYAENKLWKNTQYWKSPRETLARNTENIFYSIQDREQTKKNGFFNNAISTVAKTLVTINPLLSFGKNTPTLSLNNEAILAILPEHISETMQYKWLDLEKKMSKCLETLARNPNVVKSYLKKNPEVFDEMINYGNKFSLNQQKMEIISSIKSESIKSFKEHMEKGINVEVDNSLNEILTKITKVVELKENLNKSEKNIKNKLAEP